MATNRTSYGATPKPTAYWRIPDSDANAQHQQPTATLHKPPNWRPPTNTARRLRRPRADRATPTAYGPTGHPEHRGLRSSWQTAGRFGRKCPIDTDTKAQAATRSHGLPGRHASVGRESLNITKGIQPFRGNQWTISDQATVGSISLTR